MSITILMGLVMRNKFSFLVIIIILSILAGFAFINKRDSAENILNNSLKQAKETNKPVLVVFHASWCKWCRHLEDALNSHELKKIIDDHFVIAYIDVLEKKDKKDELENPGGEKIMNDMGGKNAGLPFYVFITPKGKKIVNSNAMPKNQNIGYPVSKSEIMTFIKLLKKSSHGLTNKQLMVIQNYLKRVAPKL